MILSRAIIRRRLWWIYRRLWREWGAQGWWPAESCFEVMVGAVLTQRTSWRNVERAIANLKDAGAFNARRLAGIPARRLEQLLRPVGFFRVKAKRLHSFLAWLQREWGGQPSRLMRRPTQEARAALLSVTGIGPETADAMLLYAGNHPVFVADAYARRILSRHGLVRTDASYDELQRLFEVSLPRDAQLYNEYHALLVRLGKTYCATVPRCRECPLDPLPRVRGAWPTKNPN